MIINTGLGSLLLLLLLLPKINLTPLVSIDFFTELGVSLSETNIFTSEFLSFKRIYTIDFLQEYKIDFYYIILKYIYINLDYILFNFYKIKWPRIASEETKKNMYTSISFLLIVHCCILKIFTATYKAATGI